jgi:cell division protein FtsL
MFVVGALSLTAAAHAFVASDQQRIDNLQAQLTETLAEQQGLQLSRAELESPTRLLKIAEHQLGMVSPSSVSYLAPVNPGPSVEQAATDAARAAAVASKTPASRSAVQGVRTAKPVTRGSRSPASGPRSR